MREVESHDVPADESEDDSADRSGCSEGISEPYGRRRVERLDELGRSLGFATEIAPNDEMAAGNEEEYFRWGLAALDYIQLALQAAEFLRAPRRILDLPCGYGRVLRMLRARFSEAEITACDLNQEGVEFCARVLGARGVVSREKPEEIELPGRYDLIWVGSLLTHVNPDRWHAFLSLFAEHLEPGGVLVFTTLGRTIIGELRRGARTVNVPSVEELIHGFDRQGFAYRDYVSEPGYGIAVARPHWVCQHLQRHSSLQLVTYTEGGWFGRQDAVACRRAPWS